MAKCSFARLQDRQGIERLQEAARKKRFSLHQKDQTEAVADACSRVGVPAPEARLWARAWVGIPPDLSGTIWEAKIARGLAEKMQARGDLKGAAQARMAVIDVGRTMWQTADDTITGLIGVAVEATGYASDQVKQEVGSGASAEGRLAARREYYRRLEGAFVRLVNKAGLGDAAPRYAHGLERVLRYSEATQRYISRPDAQPMTRVYKSLGMGYSAAPASWLVLGVLVAAATVVALLGLLRRKSVRPSARTMLGVSIVGGVVCLGLLVGSGILAAKSPYGYGWLGAGKEVYIDPFGLGSSSAALSHASKHGHGFPGTTVLYGLGVVAIVAASGLILILRPTISRLWRVVFSVASPIAVGCFWGYAWLTWLSESSKVGAWGITLHCVFGAASVAAIAGIWVAWARAFRRGAKTWLAAVAAFFVFAALSTLFIPLSRVTGVPRWVIVSAVPVSVALAALTPRLVAVARLPAGERPSYLRILRPALATCLVWILALQFASLIWLGAWRVKAAHEIEQAQAVSENQAVLRIMKESGGVSKGQ
jgi:hypothetical protein